MAIGKFLFSADPTAQNSPKLHFHFIDSPTQSSVLKSVISGIRRRNGRGLQRRSGRSFDPSACDILDGGGIHGGPGFKPPYQSSSELSSPSNETCYSFVRKALQVRA